MKKIWLLSTLSLSLFGECHKEKFLPMEPMNDASIQPSYNYAANPDIGRENAAFIEGEFIYWRVSEDFLNVGEMTRPEKLIEGSQSREINTKVLGQEFSYKPGFRIALGCNTAFDHWAVLGRWTRLHETVSTSFTGLNIQQAEWTDYYDSRALTPHSTQWTFSLNFFDLEATRPFYQGTRVIATATTGLRAMTLNQKFAYKFTQIVNETSASILLKDNYASNSWGIGPYIGTKAEWLAHKNVRVLSNLSIAMLYARYTKNHFETVPDLSVAEVGDATGSITDLVFTFADPQLQKVIPDLSASIGLGFGGYVGNDKCYLDCVVAYSFETLLGANVMTNVVSSWIGDIYMQGLTVSLSATF